MRNYTHDDVQAGQRARELVDLADAMALVGETDAQAFWVGVQVGRYPQPAERWQHAGKTRRNGNLWKPRPRWRRGELELALVRLQERKIKGL